MLDNLNISNAISVLLPGALPCQPAPKCFAFILLIYIVSYKLQAGIANFVYRSAPQLTVLTRLLDRYHPSVIIAPYEASSNHPHTANPCRRRNRQANARRGLHRTAAVAYHVPLEQGMAVKTPEVAASAPSGSRGRRATGLHPAKHAKATVTADPVGTRQRATLHACQDAKRDLWLTTIAARY